MLDFGFPVLLGNPNDRAFIHDAVLDALKSHRRGGGQFVDLSPKVVHDPLQPIGFTSPVFRTLGVIAPLARAIDHDSYSVVHCFMGTRLHPFRL
jgi:hypothetical protein